MIESLRKTFWKKKVKKLFSPTKTNPTYLKRKKLFSCIILIQPMPPMQQQFGNTFVAFINYLTKQSKLKKKRKKTNKN